MWQFIFTVLTLIVSAVTLGLVFRQVQIMNQQQKTMQSQSSLMQRQLEITQKQDELMASQLSKRADLSLKVDFKILRQQDKSIRGYTFSFSVCNKGNKSATDHYWHIRVPFEFSRLQRMEGSENAEYQPKSDEKNGQGYSYYSGFTAEPVYPSRTKLIGEISLGDIPLDKTCVVLWKMIAEDGAFPEHDFAELEVSLVEAA